MTSSKPAASTVSKKLIVLSGGEEVPKRIETHLRNAGHAVRTQWLDELDSLRGQLKREPPDLILCGDDVAGLTARDVLALRDELAPDVPVLLMAEHRPSPSDTVDAMAAGAADAVAAGDARHLHHLQLACLRELAALDRLRELRQARIRLAEFESRTQRILAASTDAVAQVQEGILIQVNKSFAQLLGHEEPSLLEGQPWMDFVAPEFQAQAKTLLKQFSQNKLKDGHEVELSLLNKDSTTVKLKARLAATQANGERAIEVQVRAEAPAATQVGASLNASGRLELFSLLAEQKTFVGLLLLRIDDFNLIEDQMGYRDAEEVVVQFMQLMRSRVPKDDAVFRFSTAEFAWLARKAPAQGGLAAMAEATRREIIAQSYKSKRRETTLKVSIAAHALDKTSVPSDVVAATVTEVRKLSTAGGNRVQLVAPPKPATAQVASGGDHAMAAQIKRALEENRLRLSYQSIASLEGDNRQHFDVLVRMLDESNKELSGGDFIPIAEKFGLVQTIDRWVMSRAIKLLAKREGAAEASELFVHLSESTLADAEGLLTWLREQLKPRPLKPDELVISVHEKVLAAQMSKAQLLMRALVPMNIQLRINHWGSGAQAEQLVEKLPARYVRFDPAFTQKFDDKARQSRLNSLLEIAKQRGIKTIVSHVEDANVMARLWQLGINYIQGHHIHEPEVVLLAADLPR